MFPINYEIRHRVRKSRIDYSSPAIIAEFWSLVEKTDTCWLWLGKTLPGPYNYGAFHSRSASRYSYVLAHGSIRPGMLICHHCDVCRCVRPDHLFEGRPIDNVHDMIAKGRNRKRLFPDAIISQIRNEWDARKITVRGYSAYNEVQRLAEKFSLSLGAIRKIGNRQRLIRRP